jgi:hypothetical protein
MTYLMTFRRLRYVCSILVVIALAGCAGAHAAKAHTRTVKPAHSSPQYYSPPRQVPAVPEVKPLVGELMP